LLTPRDVGYQVATGREVMGLRIGWSCGVVTKWTIKQVLAKDMQTPGAENAKNAETEWLYKWIRRSVAAGNATFEMCSDVYAR
jgi:hypothetical protein